MDDILIYGGVENIPMYNCSARTPEQWSTETGASQPIIGSIQIAYGVVVNLLYIPIIIIMLDKDNFKLSCFKIMFQLAITDFLVIFINSILTGILGIQGAVYCTYPTLIYITGSVAMSLWCSSCCTSLILVCNRLLVMSKPHLESAFFENKKTFLILSCSIIYGICFLFTTPHVYNSKHHAWFFDPMIFPERSKEYDNLPHAINNFSIVVLTCILYIPFYLIVKDNLKGTMTESRLHSTSVLICFSSQVAAIIYVIMNLTEVSAGLILFGHFLWQLVHGAPVFIYIILNDMIRRRFFKMLRCNKNNSTAVGISIINQSNIVPQ
ncbi:hypothetical protein GCK72_020145 [Caenorhabditis remanei]|uniref:G-protein coupled receptors family 1 profile domain-containing protein n=1 Tax=Caenorhabditis remanei TaxID=31234 RepID=A0A6A5GEJ4_CAERE|nr:hypothetical protein GCK72_020145 [Caenorhabditis remanei]KAF1753588.1 hypothetical protein GCK72_020145 [Caenorhabditis remanei]